MSKIDKFLAHPVEVEVGGEKVNLLPFTVDDLPMITRMGDKDPEVSAKAIREAVSKVVKQIDPEATEEQISKLKLEYVTEIVEAIGKVNNIEMDDAKAKLIAKIKEKQNE